MCDYQGYEFGAGSYPDSVCIDGRLLDADNCDGDGNLYDNEEDIPCPMCRPTESVSYWAERNRFGGDIDHDEAMAMAMSLVTDIRANRGVFDDFEPPAATCNDLPPEIEMEDINVKCCRCRNTHLHSARKESAPDRYGMRTLVCPRCGAKEFYKPEPKKGQPQPSGD